MRLWRNECLRVFHDRLITEEDRTLVRDALIGQMITEAFPQHKEVSGCFAESCQFRTVRLDCTGQSNPVW